MAGAAGADRAGVRGGFRDGAADRPDDIQTRYDEGGT